MRKSKYKAPHSYTLYIDTLLHDYIYFIRLYDRRRKRNKNFSYHFLFGFNQNPFYLLAGCINKIHISLVYSILLRQCSVVTLICHVVHPILFFLREITILLQKNRHLLPYSPFLEFSRKGTQEV